MNRAVDAVLGLLLEAGFTPNRAIPLGYAVFAFITGFVLLAISSASHSGPVPEPEPDLRVLSRLREDLAAHPLRASLDDGIELLLAGLEGELDGGRVR